MYLLKGEFLVERLKSKNFLENGVYFYYFKENLKKWNGETVQLECLNAETVFETNN